MNKAELSSYLENLKLAASKYSSFSLHLNELKKSVLAVGRPVVPDPVKQEDEFFEDEIASEEKELVCNTVASVSDVCFSDTYSNSLEDRTEKCAGTQQVEEIKSINADKTDSTADLSSSSDEDNDQIYGELLKQIQYEESRQMSNGNSDTDKNNKEVSDVESQTSDSNSIEHESDSGTVLQNNSKQPCISLFKRTKEIMECIEEKDEELEAINEKILLGNGNIDSETLLLIKTEKHCAEDNISNRLSTPNQQNYLDDFIKNNKKVNSKLSTPRCEKSCTQRKIRSRKSSLDCINSGFSDTFSIKSKEVTLNRTSFENLISGKCNGKKVPSQHKYASKKPFKINQNINIKSSNKIQRKPVVGNKLNPKLKATSKIVTGNIPQKNICKEQNTITQLTGKSKRGGFKSIYTLKKTLSPKSFGNSLKTKSPNNEMIKNIEPLIKSKPDNLFIKNDKYKTSDKIQLSKGSGDGNDNKVRSQAIIDSMNYSLNLSSNKSFVPSHIVKPSIAKGDNLTKTQINKSFKQRPTVENHTLSEISSMKIPGWDSQLNSNLRNNTTVGSYKSDVVLSQAELKTSTTRRESTTASPKEILAQLEKEINHEKCKEIVDNENNVEAKCSRAHNNLYNKTSKKHETVNTKRHREDKNKSENLKNSKISNATSSKDASKNSDKKLFPNPGKKEVNRLCNKISPMNALSNTASSNDFKFFEKDEIFKRPNIPDESLSRMNSKMVNLNFVGAKTKLTNFPFILGQSTSKSYNIQANLQQALSIMMMLPTDSVQQTLSVETRLSSRASNKSNETRQSHQVRCPACILKPEQDSNNLGEDPWDTEYACANFVRCTCLPRNTVSFKTVMKQLLMTTSMGSILPISETSAINEESDDKNCEKQLCRRTDLSHLIKLLHATQRIRDRLVT